MLGGDNAHNTEGNIDPSQQKTQNEDRLRQRKVTKLWDNAKALGHHVLHGEHLTIVVKSEHLIFQK